MAVTLIFQIRRIFILAAPHINNCSRKLSHFVASDNAPQLQLCSQGKQNASYHLENQCYYHFLYYFIYIV